MIELTGYTDKHEYVNKHGVKSVVYLTDCMDAMAQMGENEFSLACVDPPYSLGDKLTTGGKGRGDKFRNDKNFNGSFSWDTLPSQEYFTELARTSKNQIIWGGNYFNLPPTRCNFIWDKVQDFSGADFELAWTSFDSASKAFRMSRVEAYGAGKTHPCEKPVALYDWIFHNYAKPNDTIFDSHCGSGSSRIAADKHNLPYLATELDADYFYAHCKRFDRYTAQMTLF